PPGAVLFEAGTADWDRAVVEPAPARAPLSAPVIHLKPSAPRPERRSPSALEGGARVAVAEHMQLARRPSFARGALVHAWLELIEWLDTWVWDEQALLAAVPRDARALDVRSELEQFRALLARSTVQAALRKPPVGRAEAPARAYRELPFALRE